MQRPVPGETGRGRLRRLTFALHAFPLLVLASVIHDGSIEKPEISDMQMKVPVRHIDHISGKRLER